jgi:glucosamine-6-phosphate deaminase
MQTTYLVHVNIVIRPTPAAACETAAEIVADLLVAKPDAVLALPAGNTPRPVYAALVRRHRAAALSFARATTFTLDEYAGIAADHPASFRRYMNDELYRQIDLPAARAHAPDGAAADPVAECARYEAAIAAAGGLDLCLLGIGGNGHIAFNEPGSPFDSRTRVVDLADDSRAAVAAAFAGEAVPGRALTIGVATILAARRCVLLAYGAGKAATIARVVKEPPTASMPASALSLHPDATIILDAAAASQLA